MAVTVAALCDGIATTLSAATGIKTTKSYNEITEGIPATECPRLQVYPDGFDPDPGSGTDRNTMSAGIQLQAITIFVDVFARKRSHIHLDMAATVDTLDAIVDVLQAQERPPFFGVVATPAGSKPPIKSFRWTWKRTVLRYGEQRYMGGRFTIVLRIA